MNNLPALTGPDLARLVAVASRIESDYDNEVVTAARMTVKTLGAHGIRIADVLTGAFDVRRPGPEPVRPSRGHQVAARTCLMSNIIWKTHELDFLRQMASRRGDPTDRQADWLEALELRAQREGVAA